MPSEIKNSAVVDKLRNATMIGAEVRAMTLLSSTTSFRADNDSH